MRLQPDANLFQQVFGIPLPLPSLLQSNSMPSVNEVVAALKQSAADWFEVKLQEQPLSTSEWQAIQALQSG
jgi:lipoate-protein ligase A